VESNLPNTVDKKVLDLVAFMRQKGFTPDEIELIAAVANPEIIHKSRKAYRDWLHSQRGIDIPYERVLDLWKKPEFHECVNLLFTQEKGAALQAVEKTLLKRATDPDDAHGVAAARLLMQANGLLGKDNDKGAGRVEQQFVKLVMDFRQGKIEGTIGTAGRARFIVETEDVLSEEEDENVFDGDFELIDEDEAA
jgi:hypothetical protein